MNIQTSRHMDTMGRCVCVFFFGGGWGSYSWHSTGSEFYDFLLLPALKRWLAGIWNFIQGQVFPRNLYAWFRQDVVVFWGCNHWNLRNVNVFFLLGWKKLKNVNNNTTSPMKCGDVVRIAREIDHPKWPEELGIGTLLPSRKLTWPGNVTLFNRSYPMRSMYGIFTYMNGWCL